MKRALAVAALVTFGCSAFRHPIADDVGVYRAVIGKLGATDRISGMNVSTWLGPDELLWCETDTRVWLSHLPEVTSDLIDSLCSSEKRAASLSVQQHRELADAIPGPKKRADESRDLSFSVVGYDSSREHALVFLRRQVARECDVGEYYVLRRGQAGWEIVVGEMRWIS